MSTVPKVADLLDELHDALTRYVVFPSSAAALAVTLWIAATHTQPAWQHATRLVIKSPQKGCGKSRLLDVIEATSFRPLVTVNATVSAIFRSIDPDDPPTLLVDEADSIFGQRSENTEELRGLLNAGFQRNRPAIRCVGPKQEPTTFPTFAMAALAAIGDVIPDTICDRALVLTMRRRAPDEKVAPFRHRRDAAPLRDLGSRLGALMRDHLDELQKAEPSLPVEDRAADTWEPLVAIADLAGGAWPERARTAAVTLIAEADAAAEEESLATKLLADLRAVFAQFGRSSASSEDVVAALRKLPESPWEKFDFTQNDLARHLKPYGIRPDRVRPGGPDTKQVRGYRLEDLVDAFVRYLPRSEPPSQTVKPSQPQVSPVTPEDPVTVQGVTEQLPVTGLTRECDAKTVCDDPPDEYDA